jgi:hypothetical protein
VHVIHMLTNESIEERVWETLSLKKSLFAGVFDFPTGEVSFAKLGRKTMLQAVKEIFANQPDRPKPLIDDTPAAPLALVQAPVVAQEPAPALASAPVPAAIGGPPAPKAALEASSVEMAAASFIEAGLRFIESIASDRAAGNSAGATPHRLDQAMSGLFKWDARTNRPALSIPLPESVTQERLGAAISALLNTFGGAAKASGGSFHRN